jgi:hypothetical protein
VTGNEVAVPGNKGAVPFESNRSLLDEYKECQKALAYWKDRKEHVVEKLLLALGDGNEVAAIDGREVLTHRGKDTVNESRLKKDHPDIWEAYQKEAEGTVLDKRLLKLARPDIWDEYQVKETRVKWDG